MICSAFCLCPFNTSFATLIFFHPSFFFFWSHPFRIFEPFFPLLPLSAIPFILLGRPCRLLPPFLSIEWFLPLPTSFSSAFRPPLDLFFFLPSAVPFHCHFFFVLCCVPLYCVYYARVAPCLFCILFTVLPRGSLFLVLLFLLTERNSLSVAYFSIASHPPKASHTPPPLLPVKPT